MQYLNIEGCSDSSLHVKVKLDKIPPDEFSPSKSRMGHNMRSDEPSGGIRPKVIGRNEIVRPFLLPLELLIAHVEVPVVNCHCFSRKVFSFPSNYSSELFSVLVVNFRICFFPEVQKFNYFFLFSSHLF